MASVTPEETARTLLRRYEEKSRENAERFARIRERVTRLVQEVAANFPGCRVYLIGSLAWGEPHEGSDIDLAVEGIGPEAIDRFGARVLMEAPAPVDVVRLEEVHESFRRRIVEEGVLLAGAKP